MATEIESVVVIVGVNARSTFLPSSFTSLAGVPATVESAGTSCMMTKEFAPILPKSGAFAPVKVIRKAV